MSIIMNLGGSNTKSTIVENIRHLTSEGRGSILLFVSAGWFLSIGVRYIYPSLLPFLQAEFNMNLTLSGILISALWAAYALGQFPGGILGDYVGERWILVFSTGISSAAVLLVSLSYNVWMVFVATIIFGLATALYGPVRFTIFTDIYEKRAGTAAGLTMAAGSIGNTVLPVISVSIASYVSWQYGFAFLTPFFVIVMIALWVVVPQRTSGIDDLDSVNSLSTGVLRRLGSEIYHADFHWLVIVHIALGFVSQGFLAFYPIFLITVKGFSSQTAAAIYGLYFALGILVQPITGYSRDRYGSKPTLLLLSTTFFVGLLAIQIGMSFIHFVLFTILLSHRNGVGVITNTVIADELPDEAKNSGLGLLRTVWVLIGTTSPTIIGYLGDRGLLKQGFMFLAVISGVTTILILVVYLRD